MGANGLCGNLHIQGMTQYSVAVESVMQHQPLLL